jgi:tryptophan-rich sensory protein
MTIRVFTRVNLAAAWLLAPYLAWVCFATALNAAIAWMN